MSVSVPAGDWATGAGKGYPHDSQFSHDAQRQKSHRTVLFRHNSCRVRNLAVIPDSAKISDICRGKRGVTPDMAMRLGRLFGQNPLFWLNLQKNWELSQLDESAYASIQPLHTFDYVAAAFGSVGLDRPCATARLYDIMRKSLGTTTFNYYQVTR